MSGRSPTSAVEFTSLVELLRARATQKPEHRVYTFLADGEHVTACLTFAELDCRARAVAALLQREGLSGERALLLFPSGLDFIVALFGCFYAGTLAVPAYPPRSAHAFGKVQAILSDARARAILADSSSLLRARRWLEQSQTCGHVRLLATDDLKADQAAQWREPTVGADTPALLQYTSGSTAAPKGVVVSHGNLLHNEKLIRAAFGQSESSVVVGWLPLYHDMGLIGNALQPLYVGASCVLMPPLAFLQRPVRWLECISRYRATTSGGPNFAYELCIQKIPPAARQSLDLSSWEVAFNGAEPVRADTLARFAAAFAPCGFRRSAFHPCYGLAEATLMVSGGRPKGDQKKSRSAVGCGRLGDGVRVAVVTPDTRRRREPGREGEIWVQSPSVAQGYWGRHDVSEKVFRARLADDDEGTFLRTGDLGFFDGDELFITGRLKELIIIRGRNHHPHDIELTVERSHPAFLPGSGVAFSVEAEDGESLVVVHELKRRAEGEAAAAVEAARRAVVEEHEIRLHEIVLVRAGTIPRTTSGKVRRFACRERYLSRALRTVCRVAADDTSRVASSGARAPSRELLMSHEARPALEAYLKELVAQTLRVEPTRLRADCPLISLGLDSLAAVELKQRVEEQTGVVLSLRALLEGGDIASLADAILRHPPDADEMRACAADESLPEHPLSYNQKSLWFLQQLAPTSGAYNLAAAARLRGQLNVTALRDAFQELINRHPSLRTSFDIVDGQPTQRIHERRAVCFVETDASGWSERSLDEHLTEEAERPFDLERDSLLRVALFARSPVEHVVLLTVHHIVADFWSLEVLFSELAAIYRRHAAENPADTPALNTPSRRQYKDYARWQQRMIASPEGARAWAYWRQQLAGELPELNLPTDRPRPSHPTFCGASTALRLSRELTARLKATGQSAGATLYMTLLAAFQVLLQRYTGQKELLVGSPFAGRSSPRWAGTVGYFVNPLVLRADLSGDPTFEQFLARTRRVVLDAFEHGDYPFALLVERLAPGRRADFAPLFRVMFVMQKALLAAHEQLAAFALGEAGARLELGDLAVESLKVVRRSSQHDLQLRVAELDGELNASLQYDPALFDASTAARLLQHFHTLLRSICDAPSQRISSLPLLTAAERHQIVTGWNDAHTENGPGGCLHVLVEAQAAHTPDAVAVIAADGQATYRELNERANRLAVCLRGLGVGPDVPVGVMTSRSSEMVVALLGVLKAGGAYVPLDPAYPHERLRFIMDDARVPVLLTESRLAERFDALNARVVCLDREREAINATVMGQNVAVGAVGDNLAYVIYTSGSTGRPKGVGITHGSAIALLRWARATFSPEELAGVLASTSICFDLSVFELFAPLSCGGKVILADDALQLPGLAASDQVTLINTVPSAMAALIRQRAVPTSVMTVNLAGEPLRQALVNQVYECPGVARVLNLYGPTEDTTYSTWTRVQAAAIRQPTVGRPIANTRAYILDAFMEPTPVGVAGELYLGGSGLARGYLNRPDLTAERFVPDPLSDEPGARLYRTGDQARYLPDGEIEFLGRLDDQVKVRGYRIEPGEIEAALGEHPAVLETAVVALGGQTDDRRLVAYFVCADGEPQPTVDELRRHLRARLPTYMLPASFVRLNALPRTPNGKIDRRSLPESETARLADEMSYAPPRTSMEETLASIWAEVLGVELVGIYDDFFERGGHSLLAVRLGARLREALRLEVSVRVVFEMPTVASMAAYVESLSETDATPPIQPTSRKGPAPLSSAQQRLWFLHQMEPGASAYHMPGAIRLRGLLQSAVLERCLKEVVRRHEILRTTFPLVAEQPLQVVAPDLDLRLPTVDLCGLSEHEREREARRLAAVESLRPFDLAAGPLFRTTLLRLTDMEHVLLLCLHHIVADGWSLDVLARELAALYRAFAQAKPSPLAVPRVQYTDYAYWQQQQLASGRLTEQLNYWKRQLADSPPALELPTDRPRPAVMTSRGASCPFALSAMLSERLRALGRAEGATLFMTMSAALNVLLYRYTGQTDILLGTPVANRNRAEVEESVGCFLNMLTLRTKLTGELSFRELLRRCRETAVEAYAHQDVPFEKVVEEMRPARVWSHTPLFQVALAAQGDPVKTLTMPGLSLSSFEVGTTAAKFDLSLLFNEADAIAGVLEYNADLFDAATAERLLAHLGVLLESVVGDPDQRLADLPMLTDAERHQLSVEWSDTRAARPPVVCAHLMFEAQAERTPDALAVTDGARRLTYRELNSRANQLARHLCGQEVGPEVTVGILLERSVEMVLAALSVLKAGAAYVPLDPAYPDERLAFMLEDARVAVLLSEARLAVRLPEYQRRVVLLDGDCKVWAGERRENLGRAPSADNLAYAIYTSGSTGEPKGVAITHGGLVNLINWHRRSYGGQPGDRATLLAGPGFDASVWELWPYLAGGASLHLPSDETRASPPVLTRWLRDEQITHCFLPTPLAEAMLEEPWPEDAALTTLLTGGDVLHNHPTADLTFNLFNHYGPTENTVVTTAAVIGEGANVRSQPPIGRPISNVEVHLLDARLRHVPVGVYGEMYVGGAGLARCYLRRPELTAARFIPHLYSTEPGARLYRTGDIARYLPDGRLEFLRRDDQQVKLRGFRVELSEVEAVLRRHPALREAAVVVQESETGEKRLIAFTVPAQEGRTPTPPELLAFLKRKLPDYMLPKAFINLASLPLTSSGKADRRALSALAGVECPRPPEGSTGSLTPVEEVLAGIWSELLGVPEVRGGDDFFVLGGHSLLAARVLSRVRSVFGAELPLTVVFENPILTSLAAAVESALGGRASESALPLCPRPSRNNPPLSFSQQRLWFLAQLQPESAAYHVSAAARAQGRLDPRALRASLDEIVRRHEILRTTFDTVDGQPTQVVAQTASVDLALVDLSELPAEARAEARLTALMQEHARHPFDLRRGPLLRVALFRLREDEHLILLAMHHIISDAWSLAVFTRELAALYEAFAQARPSPLAELPIQYADFAVWQQAWLRGGAFEGARAFWRRQLEGLAPLALPTDRPRPPTQTFRGASRDFELPAELSAALRSFSRGENVTLFMTLLAVFKLLLSYYSRQDEIVVGTDVANRRAVETEELIGFFVNTLVLRMDLGGNPTFGELLARVRGVVLGAYTHQDMPFHLLVRELQPRRDLSRNPLFQVMFILQNAPPPVLQLRGLTLRQLAMPHDASPFDLTVSMEEGAGSGGIRGTLRYSTDLFDAATITRMSADYVALLRAAASQPDARLDALTSRLTGGAGQGGTRHSQTPARKLEKLAVTKSKKVVRSSAELVKAMPGQTDAAFPFVLSPAVADIDLAAWAADQRELVERWLFEHGALLFRGFDISSLAQFEQFTRATSRCLMAYTERSSPRTPLQGHVYTSTDHPADQIIPLHNEQSYTLDWPMKLWFCCFEPAASGGGTIIADSRKILRRLEPHIIEQFTRRQIMYVRNYGNGLGLSWQEAFQTDDRAVVEERCREAAIEFEWKDQARLRTRQVRPAVRRHPQTGAPVWFNHAAFFHPTSLERPARASLLAAVGEDELPTNTFYGDHSAIEPPVLEHIREAYRRETVSFLWRRGDLLMLDNMLTAHGRESFTGRRRVAVVMGDPYGTSTT
jgi:amino acid adenylation domain-containing protein